MSRRMHRGPAAGTPGDRLPALMVKIGRYPLHHGGVGAIRTLGRLGVPVYAIVEDRFTPAAVSTYTTGYFPWPTTGTERVEHLVEVLLKIGARIPGGRSVAVATDDEAAVLLGEHADVLSERFVLPPVPPGLPRALASKEGLDRLCRKHDVPTPWSTTISDREQIAEVADQAAFPVVLKNAEPWHRLSRPAVTGSLLVRSRAEFLSMARDWPRSPHVLVQEYLPHERTTDWATQICCDGNGDAVVVFTGVKVRSWPPRAGVTTYAFTKTNPELAAQAARFCKAIGYAGFASLDWRLDHRDGRYKLLDFNPRVGSQFRLFQTDQGVDLVRAHYLTLTGTRVPLGVPIDGRRLIVEHLDVPARFAYRGERRVTMAPRRTRVELAWAAADDPLPAVAAAARFAPKALSRLARLGVGTLQRHRAAG